MSNRCQVGFFVTKAQHEKLKKIAEYLRETRGTNGSISETMRCLIDEVYAKLRTKNVYKREKR